MSDDSGHSTDGIEQNHPEPVSPNCPEHDTTMRFDESDESWYCPQPCGWRFHL